MRLTSALFNLSTLALVAFVPIASFAQPVCVTVAKAILRKGPGTNFPVSWTAAQYMPLMRVKSQGAWVQVQDLDGELHWVAAQSISSRVNCLVIRKNGVPLRSGPGQEHPLAEFPFADRYTPFKKVDRDGAWIKIQDDYRTTFWVYETNVWIPIMKSKITF